MRHPRSWFPCVRVVAAAVSAWLVVAHVVTPGGDARVVAQSSKFTQSIRVFVDAWQKTFAFNGKTFPAPRFVPFQGQVTGTGCGTVAENNAYFCPADNAIYYDTSYISALSQDAGRMTGTDGDYAPIAVVGHELGHAVQTHLQPYATTRQGWSYRIDTNRGERLADCLAGSSTRSAEAAGLLDRTDLGEALAVMKIAGSPELAAPSLRLWIQRHAERHPAPGVRSDMFRAGYDKGAMACGDVVALLRASAGKR